jgi:hypothetical protein
MGFQKLGLMWEIVITTILLNCSILATNAQTRTEETTISIDSSTGKTTKVYSVRILTTEDITPRVNMLIINPIEFFFSSYNISYYRRLNNYLGFGGGIHISTTNELNDIGIELEGRYYLSGKSLKGFYCCSNIYANRQSYSISVRQLFSIAFLAGWQWFLDGDFAIGLALGVNSYLIKSTDDLKNISYSNGFEPKVRITIGYVW